MQTKIETVLDIFTKINAIPRCSKKEAAIARWLGDWAERHGFGKAYDPAGNLVVQVPASPGFEAAPVVVLQGHMDMVCEKTPDSDHDFDQDPIRVIRDGDWLRADQTTLGADNGIALALAMAIVTDDGVSHPPLELLFTVDEETGLIGVQHLDPTLITGKILINIDSEDDRIFTIGCAGGEETRIRLKLDYETVPEALRFYRVVVGGLRGGHSGVDIHKPRANANRLLGRLLAALTADAGLRLATLSGGSAHNAIPRDAQAVVGVADAGEEALQTTLARFQNIFVEESGQTEPQLALQCEPLAEDHSPRDVLRPASADRAIMLLNALPHGVQGMSIGAERIVETSCNLAILKTADGHLDITSSQRSACMTRLDEITARVQAVAALAGATTTRMNHHPSWPPDTDSALLRRCQEVYTRQFGEDALVEVMHAGLECGLIGAKVPGMEMISIGPTLRNPHSPDEKLFIPSVGKMLQFLEALLASYKE